jgi:hypothetical protein
MKLISNNFQNSVVYEPKKRKKQHVAEYDDYDKPLTEIISDGIINTNCKLCGTGVVKNARNLPVNKKCSCSRGNEILKKILDIVESSGKNSKKNINVQNIVTNNNNSILINNTNNNINIVNNIYQTIKINPFGKEKLDMLTTDYMNKIIENPDSGIVKLIKFIHFNPEIPENHNVIMKNKRDQYVDVFNGEVWEKQQKDVAIHNLISSKKDIMDDHYETMVENSKVNNIMIGNYAKFNTVLDPYIKHLTIKDVNFLKKKKILKLKEFIEDDGVEKKCEKLYKTIFNNILIVMLEDKIINKDFFKNLNKANGLDYDTEDLSDLMSNANIVNQLVETKIIGNDMLENSSEKDI